MKYRNCNINKFATQILRYFTIYKEDFSIILQSIFSKKNLNQKSFFTDVIFDDRKRSFNWGVLWGTVKKYH